MPFQFHKTGVKSLLGQLEWLSCAGSSSSGGRAGMVINSTLLVHTTLVDYGQQLKPGKHRGILFRQT